MNTERPLEENDNYLLFPPRLLGHASFLSTTPKTPRKNYKGLIESLVASHESNEKLMKEGEGQLSDVVNNKGKRLVLLLHGMFQIPEFNRSI